MNVHETQSAAYQEDVAQYKDMKKRIQSTLNKRVLWGPVAIISFVICAMSIMAMTGGIPYRENFTHMMLGGSILVGVWSAYKWISSENEVGKLETQRKLLVRKMESRAVISSQKIEDLLQKHDPEMVTRYQIVKEHYGIKNVDELE